MDRRELIRNELAYTGLTYERFPGISGGAIGCSKSHIEVLKLAKKNRLKNVLILEDDFQFLIPPNQLENKIKQVKEDYDVLMLAYNLREWIPGEVVCRVQNASTTAGYIVNERYYDTLLENFEEGLVLLEHTGNSDKYSIDVYWHRLQARDDWLCFTERIGLQRASYSDVCHQEVNYGV